MPHRGKIPRPTIKRLSLYLRELEALRRDERVTISSRQLGDSLGLTDAQVRKDLACFGQFGHPGVGYHIAELIERLKGILGTDRAWRAAIVGAGNIGRAVLSYDRLASKGFEIAAVFDRSPTVVGSAVGGHTVRPMEDLPAAVTEMGIVLGLLAVPPEAAQQVAEEMISAGIRGILNFAPVRLEVDDSISILTVDLTVSLEQLAFQVSLGQANDDCKTGSE